MNVGADSGRAQPIRRTALDIGHVGRRGFVGEAGAPPHRREEIPAKRILLVAYYYPPSTAVAALRMRDWANICLDTGGTSPSSRRGIPTVRPMSS